MIFLSTAPSFSLDYEGAFLSPEMEVNEMNKKSAATLAPAMAPDRTEELVGLSG